MRVRVRFLLLVLSFVSLLFSTTLPSEDWGIGRLERSLIVLMPDDDDSPSSETSSGPSDALKEFSWFLRGSGWSTNKFIETLFYEMTNGYEQGWSGLDARRRKIVGTAAWKLGEIDSPMVTNFFRICNANSNMWCKYTTYCGMLTYTNLEPEVLDYLRTLWVRTNEYDKVSFDVYCTMLDVMRTMDDNQKPAATNRIARYAYGTLRQLTRFQAAQDTELAKLVPLYSNSVQRLAVMRDIVQTATNEYMRAKATRLVQELSAVPASELNDLPWLTGPVQSE